MGWLGDLVKDGIGEIAGPVLGFLGGTDANNQNAAIASANNAFNAEQAGINRAFQGAWAQHTMNFNADEAAKNRQFQQYNSDTQYQRGVKDLEAAGLNPMLSLMKGGAGTPGGGQASASSPSGSTATSSGNPNMRDVLSPAITSAFGQAKIRSEIEQMHLQNDNLKEQNNLIRSQVRETEARADNLNAGTTLSGAQATQSAAQTQKLMEELPEIRARINLLKEQTESEGVRRVAMQAQADLNNAEELYTRGKISYQQYTAAIEKATAHLVNNQTFRSDNEAAGERNYEWFNQHIRPLLPSILSSTGSAAAAANAAAGVLRARK